ncbi:hypothetical protein BCR37DRAFT_318570 [Protomyces lactucae-debilis]|uniref:Secreted protein n=1 Tax=Protomyces lactucae-debilis TaxID=2754530 RepID=A0A1Y2FFA6_PROLT|nr:uncharacterized protein BCR37DRAFT_318570 [Protomyces lactucae-debilis]ORY82650.1 hypothetical protein BCR37DRAFT_318570 [Protomyces lactucae-debilis]
MPRSGSVCCNAGMSRMILLLLVAEQQSSQQDASLSMRALDCTATAVNVVKFARLHLARVLFRGLEGWVALGATKGSLFRESSVTVPSYKAADALRLSAQVCSAALVAQICSGSRLSLPKNEKGGWIRERNKHGNARDRKVSTFQNTDTLTVGLLFVSVDHVKLILKPREEHHACHAYEDMSHLSTVPGEIPLSWSPDASHPLDRKM